MSVTILLIVGGLIILGLASYAVHLLRQVNKQKQLEQQVMNIAVAKRNANIFDSVNTLCFAGIQGQCDLSEVSIRIYCILDYIQGDDRIDVEKQYPALYELYDIVKDMARGDARQELAKQDRMKQTLARQKAEARLAEDMIEDLKKLQVQIQPLSAAPQDTVTATK